MPRHYECECMSCGTKRTIEFCEEPYPKPKDTFLNPCPICGDKTNHTRAMTKKTLAELHREQAEEALRSSIVQKCDELGFKCRFLYQSVIVTTHLADWSFDYHQSRITLYHESTIKVNFETGNYAKSHLQFANRKMKPLEVINYIASHDAWRSEQLTGDPEKATSGTEAE